MPSQNNEDEILQRICERCQLATGFFIEIGASPEENNTDALEKRGWKGVRVDKTGGRGIIKQEIGPDNAVRMLSYWRGAFDGAWLLSVDIDGNDYHVVRNIIYDYGTPDVLVVEYNATKGPDVDYIMPFDENYVWRGGDEYGASLRSWLWLLTGRMGLVETNGVNAFFVTTENLSRYYFKPSSHAIPEAAAE